MSAIRSFDTLLARLAHVHRRFRVAVINAVDASTIEALCSALEAGFVEVLLVGEAPSAALAQRLAPFADHVRRVEVEGEDTAAARAVDLVRQGEVDILMKGLLHTDNLLRAVLNKEQGLLPAGRVLSHITVAEIPQFPRLLFITDVAVIPEPTDQQRESQVAYVDALCRSFGIEAPRIGLVHFTEKVSP